MVPAFLSDGSRGRPESTERAGRYVVRHAYRCAYPDPLALERGDILRWERRESQWAGWVWCTDAGGRGGWVPEAWLRLEPEGTATALRGYVAVELSVLAGDTVDVAFTESGWAWATDGTGHSGWLPLANLSPA
jgi:hypothetical protein